MKKIGLLIAAAVTVCMMGISVFAENPGSGLKDIKSCMGMSWRNVGDELDFEYFNYVNGIYEICLENEAVVLYCEEEIGRSNKELPVIAIDLNRAGEGMYRIGDLWIGENISDAGYYLYQNGFSEISTQNLNEDYYDCVYINVTTGFAFEVTYDRFSYVTRVQYRHMTEWERVNYAL